MAISYRHLKHTMMLTAGLWLGMGSMTGVHADQKDTTTQTEEHDDASSLPTFNQRNFLKNLDRLLSEQAAVRRDLKQSRTGELTLKLGDKPLPDIRSGGFRVETGQKDKDEDFLYLRDATRPKSENPVGLVVRPDFSSLLAPGGDIRSPLKTDFALTGAQIGLSLGNEIKNDGSIDPGFLIAVESAYRMSRKADTVIGFNDTFTDLAEHAYNVGLTVGYSGFNLDASVRREWSPFETDLSGVDLGFSYQANTWSARLGWSAYRAGKDLVGFENDARDFVSVELGANLKLSDNIGLTGGVRYYEYDTSWHLIDATQGDTSQMVFVGGRLKF